MAYLRRQDALFHYAPADAFTVCDAYHRSFIGNTDPNRYHLWSGWTGNDGKGGGPVLLTTRRAMAGRPTRAAGVGRGVLEGLPGRGHGAGRRRLLGWTNDAFIGNYGDTLAALLQRLPGRAKPGDPLYQKARVGTRNRDGQGYFDLLAADVAADRLPQVSWISAPEAFTEHSNWPTDFGAWYLSKVRRHAHPNPEVWGQDRPVHHLRRERRLLRPPGAPAGTRPGRARRPTVSTVNEHYAGGDPRATPGPYGHGGRGCRCSVVRRGAPAAGVCPETLTTPSGAALPGAALRVGSRRSRPGGVPWRAT